MGRVIPKELKEKVDSEFCYYCGRKLNSVNKTFDHIIPVNKGGEDKIDNLVCSCADCNQVKNNMTLFELITQLNRQKDFCDDEVRLARLNYHIKIFDLARQRLNAR